MTQLLIAIPLAKVPKANEAAAVNWPNSTNCFTISCSATGNTPATHMACCVNVEGDTTKLIGLVEAFDGKHAEVLESVTEAWDKVRLEVIPQGRKELV